jgi:hypothetical protein
VVAWSFGDSGSVEEVAEFLASSATNMRTLDIRGLPLTATDILLLAATLAAAPRHCFVQRLLLQLPVYQSRIDPEARLLAAALRGGRKLRHVEVGQGNLLDGWTLLFASGERIPRTVVIGAELPRAFKAVAQGRSDVVAELAPAEVGETMGRRRVNLMALAALHDDAAVVRALLARGHDKDRGDRYNNTPLMSCTGGAAARVLLDAGCSREARAVDSSTALSQAVQRGDSGMVALLLAAGCSPDSGVPCALVSAVKDSRVDIAALLLAAECNATVKTFSGRTVLEFAQDRGCSAMVELLARR